MMLRDPIHSTGRTFLSFPALNSPTHCWAKIKPTVHFAPTPPSLLLLECIHKSDCESLSPFLHQMSSCTSQHGQGRWGNLWQQCHVSLLFRMERLQKEPSASFPSYCTAILPLLHVTPPRAPKTTSKHTYHSSVHGLGGSQLLNRLAVLLKVSLLSLHLPYLDNYIKF